LKLAVKKYLSLLLKSDIAKNTSLLVSGTAIAQIIPIALQPFLRRQFSAESYGAYSVYLSLLGIVSVIAAFKYELAIILPKKSKEAANVLFLSVFASLLFNVVLFLAVFLFKNNISNWLNLPGTYSFYLYFVPAASFFYSFYQVMQYWLIREKKFLPISVNKFIRRGTEGAIQSGLSFTFAKTGLLWGDLLGHIANAIAGGIQSFRSGLKFRQLSKVKIKYVAKKYAEYPRFNLLPGLMSACSYLLPALFINGFYTLEYTGYFDLSRMVLSIPLALVAGSISSVMLQRLSEKKKNKKGILKDVAPVFLFVLVLAIIEIIVISLFGKPLFQFFFGRKNTFSGELSEILVWSYAFNFVNASLSSIFIALKKIKILSIWQLFYFLAIGSLLFFRNSSFTDFLKIYVSLELICYFLSVILMGWIVWSYEKAIAKSKSLRINEY
jgi:teichuronic acid exporter